MQDQVTVTVNGVECVSLYPFAAHSETLETLGAELGLRKNGVCTLCSQSGTPTKCTPCPVGVGVGITLKYWPILKMRLPVDPSP